MPHDYVLGLIGGGLIGVAAVLMFIANGRIMGVSGIASRLFQKPNEDSKWRLAFILGLIFGGFVYQGIYGIDLTINSPFWVLALAGLLVGYGTVMANGCTSGHGICGISRLSKRSIIATLTFMAFGIAAVYIRRMAGG